MIVNTMIGKAGGGGDVTVQATELTIDSENVVHIKFPGLPAGATVKNLNVIGINGACVVSDTTYDICSLAGRLSSGDWYYRFRAIGIAKTERSTITVGDDEISFSRPSAMTSISLSTSSTSICLITYEP